MMTEPPPANPIAATVPYDAEGAHHGFLRLPHSWDESAWGSLMIPISVIANGDGPTALLTGANHGDEYEGPVALQALTHELDPAEVTGRLIVAPFMNMPAFQAARRVSPIDGVNMNRCFPGRPNGTPTERIADYFLTTLVPMADIVLDYHSGGKSLDFVPFAAAHVLPDARQQEACVAAMQAFNAPYSMILKEQDPSGLYDTAVERSGKVFVSTELGGGGTVTAASAAIARRGLRNLLRHAGILAGAPELGPSTRIDTTVGDCFHLAERGGLVEPLVDLGATVSEGDALARIWPIDRTGGPAGAVLARHSGVLAGRHFPGLIRPGDCLAVVASVLD